MVQESSRYLPALCSYACIKNSLLLIIIVIMMLKLDEKCNFGNNYIFTSTLDTDFDFDISFRVLSSLSVQNLE